MVFGIFSPTQTYFALCKKKIVLVNPDSLLKIAELDKIPTIDDYDAQELLFSPNGNKLILYSTENNLKIDIWNLITYKIQDSIILSGQIRNPKLCPDNNKIILNTYWAWSVYNLNTKDSIYSFPDYIIGLDISPNMNFMIMNLRDSNLVLIETPQAITSIKEDKFENNDFNIYPNPSTNAINIDYPENLYGTKIEIYNSMGVSLWMGRAESKQIDVSNLAAGVYFLRIGNETKMFVKE